MHCLDAANTDNLKQTSKKKFIIKTIIRKYILTGLFLIGVSSIFAQKSGVFKTFAHYRIQRMEFGIDCKTEKHQIKLNDFFGKDFITVIHNGKSYKIKKSEIWGFQSCDSSIVRFQGKEDFQVREQSILWVYSKKNIVLNKTKTGGSNLMTSYFFSKGGDGEIKELTLQNIKGTFPQNHKLHDLIDNQFKSDASLEDFDTFHKMYQINHFLESQDIK